MLQFSDFINKSNIKDNLLVIYGAGTIGRLTLEALIEKNVKVNFFCDSDVKKKNTAIDNIKILSPDELDKLDKNTNIFVAAHYFSSIVPLLQNKGFKNLFKSTDLLESIDIEKIKLVEIKRQAKEYERTGTGFEGKVDDLTPLKLDRVISFYNEMGRKEDYIKDGKLSLKTIDIQITEKCSLKCKDCSNLMQYYERPKDSDLELLFKSIDRFMECVDGLDEFRVLGGDPFMNKELYKIVNKLVTYEKCKKVAVYTNARIIPKGENLECLRHEKVLLDITNYGESSSAHLKLIDLAKKEKLKYSSFRCTTWQDCGRIMPFADKSEKDLEFMFQNCCNSDLISLLHGKLYRCPFSANGVNLKAIPQKADEEVDLLNEKLSTEELREQIKRLCYEKKYLTACSYCNGRDYTSVDIPSALQTKQPLPYEIVNN